MNNQKGKNNVSSALRDKYLAATLKEAHKLSPKTPKLSELRGIDYLLPKIDEYIKTPLTSDSNIHGVILHGVQGVGKAFITKCIAQEMEMPLIYCEISDKKDIAECFKNAEILAPCLVLIEDLDEIVEPCIINQIRNSIENIKEKVLVIGTTRYFKVVDSKVVGYNLFEVDIAIRVPTVEDRFEILTSLLCSKNPNVRELVRITPGFSGSEIAKLIKLAHNRALSRKEVLNDSHFTDIIHEIKKPLNNVTFEDIGALEDVKDVLNYNIILPSLHPEIFKSMGISKPSGILLYGPPGCGKTMLAKAVSNMSHCNFMSIRGPELISKYVGDSEKDIRILFEKAKAQSPCVVFFDEIDSICSRRTGNAFGNRIVNQILTILDGLEDRGSVYIIAATNRLKCLDKALLRPGRFDRIIEVPHPTEEECRVIFEKALNGIPHEQIDVSDFVLKGFSGADVCGIIKEAGLCALKKDFYNGKITREDIYTAIEHRVLAKRCSRN